MAVYQRSFQPYEAGLTSSATRFLVPMRYALQDLFKSKLFTVFTTLCFVFPLLCVFAIYLRHNADLLSNLAAAGLEIEEWMPIDGTFFGVFMRVQGTLAFFLVLFSGPRLVSRDIANNGLALYLCRPFSKTQYVIGKLGVLVILCSLATWVPGLLLWSLQGGLEGLGWAAANTRSALALLIGSWVWILVLGLLALAISAWVKWRPVAGFCLLLIFFGGVFFARVVDILFNSPWGLFVGCSSLDPTYLGPAVRHSRALFLRPALDLPGWSAWATLGALVALSLFLLNRRIRAYEVVR